MHYSNILLVYLIQVMSIFENFLIKKSCYVNLKISCLTSNTIRYLTNNALE